MPGDRDREGNSRGDRDRDRGRHNRDGRESSSHRRRRSASRDRIRLKREEDDSPRQRPRNRSPRRERSLSPYSKRAQKRWERRHSPERGKKSVSPEAWGSHQHDLAHDRANPPPSSPPPKQKPNYGLSGLLAAATNTKNGTVLKYNEPPEGKKTKGWRVYIFKDGKEIDVLNLDGQSSFLVGRDRAVADIPVDHTSCSKQHAVVQFRQVSSKNEFGDVSKVIKPYVIDLESTNGTTLNGEKLDSRRFFEIRTEDMIKFGESSREYIFIKDPAVQ